MQAVRKGRLALSGWTCSAVHKWNFFFREALVPLWTFQIIESGPLKLSRIVFLS